MSYKAKLNNTTFFDTDLDSEKYKLTSAQVNGLKSFAFTVPLQNLHHGKFIKGKDFVEVYKEERQIFAGRVYSLNDTLEKSQKVVCEHVAAVLNDSVHRPITYETLTNREVFERLIENHNSMVSDAKKLTIGRITVTAASCYRPYEKIEKTSKRINDLIDSFGGHLAFRREYTDEGIVTYIDWLKDYDEGCNQTIRLGKNILDIKKESSLSGKFNALIPYGATDDDGNQLDIKSVNNGLDYIMAPQDIVDAMGGPIFETVTFNDVTVASNLLAKAQQYLRDAYTEKITINVTAVDLADAGYDVESFHVGQSIHVISEPHGIDGWFDCTDQTINLLNPASNKLTLGNTVTGHIETQRKQIEAIKTEAELQKTALQKAVERAASLITGNKGGYVVFHDSDEDGFPDEILIMDTPSIETARKVWRWNKSGLGYSSTGYDGEYGTAMTIDGEIVADYVNTGALNAELIKVGILKSQEGDNPNFYLDLINGILKGKFTEIAIVAGGEAIDITAANSKVEVEYAESDSTTTAPTTGWSTATPAYTEGKYIWLRNKFTDMKGNVTYSHPACITGNKGSSGTGTKGDPGEKGDTGKGISSVEVQYAQNQSKITAPSTGWSTTLPGWLPDYHIWLRNKITYTDNTVSYTTPSLQADLDQTEIFNRLTNNGQLQGIFMENGKLYINGEFIKANSIKATSVDITNLFAQAIIASNLKITGGEFDVNSELNTSKIKLAHTTSGGLKYVMEMSPNELSKTFYKSDGSIAYKTSLGSQGIVVKDENGVAVRYQNNGVQVKGGMFKIVEKSMALTIPATGSYYKEGTVKLTADTGYEIIGLAGFYLSGNSQMMNVYRCTIDTNNTLWYGISNTGSNSQNITFYYYLVEAKKTSL